jgi:hypothetical protein
MPIAWEPTGWKNAIVTMREPALGQRSSEVLLYFIPYSCFTRLLVVSIIIESIMKSSNFDEGSHGYSRLNNCRF